jgi:hypothetical protein
MGAIHLLFALMSYDPSDIRVVTVAQNLAERDEFLQDG